jgi:hypothetical protein
MGGLLMGADSQPFVDDVKYLRSHEVRPNSTVWLHSRIAGDEEANMTPAEAKDKAKKAVEDDHAKYKNQKYKAGVISTDTIGNVKIFLVGFYGDDYEYYVNYATMRGDDKLIVHDSLNELARALNEDSLEPRTPETNFGSVVRYALASAFMLALTLYVTISYFDRAAADVSQQAAFRQELLTSLAKANAIENVAKKAQELKSFLGETRQTEYLQTQQTLQQLSENLIHDVDEAHAAIASAQQIAKSLKSGSTSFLDLSLINTAYAQGTNRLFNTEKEPFIWFGFLLLTALMTFCLWTIARPGAKDVDKRWAKELLNRQFVFLGGVIGGTLMKY